MTVYTRYQDLMKVVIAIIIALADITARQLQMCR
jgi:hypothetical protein